jgi:hypothetical protein
MFLCIGIKCKSSREASVLGLCLLWRFEPKDVICSYGETRLGALPRVLKKPVSVQLGSQKLFAAHCLAMAKFSVSINSNLAQAFF